MNRWQSRSGLTLIEAVVLLGVLVVLACVFLPALATTRRDRRFDCVLNLKHIGSGFRLWAADHGEKLPWQVSETKGGTLEYGDSANAFQHFLVASNELDSPKILRCYADNGRLRALFWTNLANSNLSYFVAPGTSDKGLLAGDRFLSTNQHVLRGLVTFTKSKGMRWAKGGHQGWGSVLFSDGSVLMVKPRELGSKITNFPIRVAIP